VTGLARSTTFSVLGDVYMGSSLSMRSYSNIGSKCSVFDLFALGSTMSVRSFSRLGSSLSIGGASALKRAGATGGFSLGQQMEIGSSLSIRGFTKVGESVSLFDFAAYGSSVSTRSFSRLGSCTSMYSYMSLGSCMSIRNFARLGSSLSAVGTAAVHNTLKVGAFQVTYSSSNYAQNDGINSATGTGGLQFTNTASSRTALMIEDTGSGAFGHLDGTWSCDSGTCITMTSDRRLKYQVHPLFKELSNVARKSEQRHWQSLDEDLQKDADTLAVIQQLRPVGYKYKKAAESKYSRFGFVAQEVESLLPALTITDPRGYKHLHLKDLIAVLTLGLQSIDRVTTALDAEITALDQRVDADHELIDPRISAVEESFLQEIIGKILETEDINLITGDIEDAAEALVKEQAPHKNATSSFALPAPVLEMNSTTNASRNSTIPVLPLLGRNDTASSRRDR
jgi:hypothetical protein